MISGRKISKKHELLLRNNITFMIKIGYKKSRASFYRDAAFTQPCKKKLQLTEFFKCGFALAFKFHFKEINAFRQ